MCVQIKDLVAALIGCLSIFLTIFFYHFIKVIMQIGSAVDPTRIIAGFLGLQGLSGDLIASIIVLALIGAISIFFTIFPYWLFTTSQRPSRIALIAAFVLHLGALGSWLHNGRAFVYDNALAHRTTQYKYLTYGSINSISYELIEPFSVNLQLHHREMPITGFKKIRLLVRLGIKQEGEYELQVRYHDAENGEKWEHTVHRLSVGEHDVPIEISASSLTRGGFNKESVVQGGVEISLLYSEPYAETSMRIVEIHPDGGEKPFALNLNKHGKPVAEVGFSMKETQ